jgi:hypothetical protein
MSQPNSPPATQSSAQQHTRLSRAQQILANLWSEWRVELFIALLVALAIFLLLERMQIRETLLGWLRQGFAGLTSFGGGVLGGVVAFVRDTTLSDLTGYVLLLFAFVFVIWRTRWRLMTMPRFTARKCPRCGCELHRVHRRPSDRWVSLVVPVARYRCRNQDCRWRGLRIKRARHE